MKRLIPQTKRKKYASRYLALKWFGSKSGLSYSLIARKMNNRIFYSIVQEDTYNSATLYESEEFEDVFEVFCELSLAIRGINYAEDMIKAKDKIYNISLSLSESPQDMTLKIKPLFLGDADLPVC